MKGDQLKFFTANVAQKESLRNLSFYLDYIASAWWNEKFYLHFFWIIIESILRERNISYTDIRHKSSFCQTPDWKCEITCCIKWWNISLWLPLRAPLKYTKFSKSKEFLLLISGNQWIMFSYLWFSSLLISSQFQFQKAMNMGCVLDAIATKS